MKSKKSNPYGYTFRGLRIYKPEDYKQFQALCKESFITPQQALNKYISDTVKSGTLQGAANVSQ